MGSATACDPPATAISAAGPHVHDNPAFGTDPDAARWVIDGGTYALRAGAMYAVDCAGIAWFAAGICSDVVGADERRVGAGPDNELVSPGHPSVDGPLTVHLRPPTPADMPARARWMSDPATMAYNAGFDVPHGGYRRDTGCIDFPQPEWAPWLRWCEAETASGGRFHAIVEVDGTAVGEAGFGVVDHEAHLHLVIDARYAGRGCGSQALTLLVTEAFRRPDVLRVVDEYPADREPAETVFLRVGFLRDGPRVVLTRRPARDASAREGAG